MTETTCGKCDGKCCRDVSIEIDKPENFDDFETIKWFLAHKNIIVYIDNDGDWMVEFETDCKFLDENNNCKIYSERYKMCLEHEPNECIMNGDGEHYERIFRTAEDIDSYMKEISFFEKYTEEKNKLMNK